jgi:hypothetical protein
VHTQDVEVCRDRLSIGRYPYHGAFASVDTEVRRRHRNDQCGLRQGGRRAWELPQGPVGQGNPIAEYFRTEMTVLGDGAILVPLREPLARDRKSELAWIGVNQTGSWSVIPLTLPGAGGYRSRRCADHSFAPGIGRQETRYEYTLDLPAQTRKNSFSREGRPLRRPIEVGHQPSPRRPCWRPSRPSHQLLSMHGD